MITILKPGFYTTIQDLGRTGYMQFGLSRSGAMDHFALKAGNHLVGNTEEAAGLECLLVTPSIRFEEETIFALTGAFVRPALNGKAVPMWTALYAGPGDILESASVLKGCRTYLTFAGGIDCPAVLSSRSTDKRSLIGGLEKGRALKAGDRLPNTMPVLCRRREGYFLPGNPPEGDSPTENVMQEDPFDYLPDKDHGTALVLRVMEGPQQDALSIVGWKTLTSQVYAATSQSDRMGIRFQGPRIGFASGQDGNILTDAMIPGSIQVPPSGQPIVMMADAQTTGGYTKPAVLIAADLRKAAQLKAGDRVLFEECEEEEAYQALKDQEQELSNIQYPPFDPQAAIRRTRVDLR